RGMRLLERWLYRVAEKIIILAPGSEGYLLSRGVQKDRIAYIPNGVHLGNFQAGGDSPAGQAASGVNDLQVPQREAAASGAGRAGEGETFTVIYTGAHGPANSLETVLEAAQLLKGQPGIRFMLVGDGPSKAALVKKAQELGLKNVLFMDPVPKEQIPSLLAGADAALITLRAAQAFAYAISPNKLFDYMAAGKPVLCAVPGDMARLVVENHAGLAVEPEDPGALAQAVTRLKEMPPAERAAMGQCGRSLVERRFSRERLAGELIRVVG
ncbi:MAG: glycosyltransferase family 4 protein, partial [Firmicutes bacterium]|nr:glycosyltransferase family 4 protein [Bacillota bacterium]